LNVDLGPLGSRPGHRADDTDAAVRWTLTNDFNVELNHPMSHPHRIIAVMSFQPITVDRPCWHCRWYEDLDGSASVAYYARIG
jgi:hypothetical protein